MQSRVPPHRPIVRLNQMLCVAGDATIGNLSGPLEHELPISGATTGTNPFGGCGGSQHRSSTPSAGGKLLQGASNELWRLGRRSVGQGGANSVVGRGHCIAKTHQCAHSLLGARKPRCGTVDHDIAKTIL